MGRVGAIDPRAQAGRAPDALRAALREPLSVSPLTWSHAQFASSVRWYAGKYRRLTQPAQP